MARWATGYGRGIRGIRCGERRAYLEHMEMMTDEDGFRIEAAEQFGFKITDDDAEQLACTESQLIAFAKACERKGIAQSAKLARTMASLYGRYDNQENALTGELESFAKMLEKVVDAIDIHLAPILEAERQRVL